MKPLASIHQMLARLCICPNDQNASDLTDITYKAFLLAQLIIHLCGAMASFAFFIKFVSIDLVESMYSFLTFIGMICTIYVVMSGLLLRHNISSLFEHLLAIYDICTYCFVANQFS